MFFGKDQEQEYDTSKILYTVDADSGDEHSVWTDCFVKLSRGIVASLWPTLMLEWCNLKRWVADEMVLVGDAFTFLDSTYLPPLQTGGSIKQSEALEESGGEAHGHGTCLHLHEPLIIKPGATV